MRSNPFFFFLCWCPELITHFWTSTVQSCSRQRGPWCKYHQIKKKNLSLSFHLRYLSELCCVDGPLGAGQATFPVVSAFLSANCNMSSITAVFSLSDGMSAQCHVALLRVLNCCPTCTMKHRITAATRTIRCCCRCWRAAANHIHGQSLHYSCRYLSSERNITQGHDFTSLICGSCSVDLFPRDCQGCVWLFLLCFT